MITEIDISKWVYATAVLAFLLTAFAYVVHLYQNKGKIKSYGKKRRLKITETLHIDTRNKICIMRFDNTEILLSVGANGVEMLGSQEPTEMLETEAVSKQNCEEDRIEGIGFLKKFVKGNCPVPEALPAKNAPAKTSKSKTNTQKTKKAKAKK